MKQTPSLFSKALHASQDWDLLASLARKSGREASQSQFHRPGHPHSQDRIATGRQTVRPGGVSLAPPSFPLSLLLAGTRLPRGWRKAPEGSGAGQAGAVSQGAGAGRPAGGRKEKPGALVACERETGQTAQPHRHFKAGLVLSARV